ncbi:NACHT domain-containing protein [Aetokthonos hydrillicola Thurmond2011]|jgi:WD40 repeat protein/predicted DNA-binding protein YlxM (UPF0122 family)|uniref:NACHT domain-containing protein n=1 Tax=Aetokthonos hydrillicola Thurmond2011 TaxID=2712845 RepID=A0AAP5I5M6_9CYAN|nr:sigma factor-like helix-turn-helix DNA-binding protein [Aetokthonos hydrillicola]MBO3459139.1 NACHT domain-containing protein [Aetokthonos hydrillicola CCALA 1050]MBW4584687.1 NACHT domain-containing protein [Aetokthonos hydrillicola CCALA 1050]MDR9895231.1 NACHT domain-containing protein [Aetokthonos hydrillicola Thurmond2011]
MVEFEHDFLVNSAKNKNLTQEQQEVFLLKFIDNLSNKEIAERLKISEAACLKRMGEVYKKFAIQGGRGKGKDELLRSVLREQFKQLQEESAQFQLLTPATPDKLVQAVEISEEQSHTVMESDLQKLAKKMRDWFKALNYEFEQYEVLEKKYFEWIIKIPVWLKYERVLVRGTVGEANLGDLMALRQSVGQHKTHAGLLIAECRISPACLKEAKKHENPLLYCYTLDELLDESADFSGYLNWLEGEIQNRGINRVYVPLVCMKEEFDPVTKQNIGISHYAEAEGGIDGYVDRWLDDPSKEHLSILGEFGTGKTWFALHYAWVALKRYQQAKERGTQRPRLPLVIQLRDYAKAVSVESLFSEFFFRKHEIPLPGYSAFEQLNRMGKLLLIFDGFDEMAARINRQEMINNFWELAKVVVPGAKVILTCRKEHFPEAKEGWALLNAELKASTASLTGETPQFEVLELEKLTKTQMKKLLLLQGGEPEVVEQVIDSDNAELLDLASRPVMMKLIVEALPDIKAGKPVDIARVYLYAVQRKMERDIKAERTFTSLADKVYFLCELAWEMYSTRQMSLNYRLFPDHIRRLFGAFVQEEKDLDHWHYDMMGQTMLIRNTDGDYTFAHRSLLEFFVAYKFAAELGTLAPDFTQLAQKKVHLSTSSQSQNYTWSSYFQHERDQGGNIVSTAPLLSFSYESLENLSKTFGLYKVEKIEALLTNFLVPMLEPVEASINHLLDVLEATKGRSEKEVGSVGSNVITLLAKLDLTALEGRDLTRAVILEGDFADSTDSRLRHVNLTDAILTGSTFAWRFGNVLSVAYTPDNSILAIGDADGRIHLCQLANTEQIMTCNGKHNGWVRSVTFSPDGKLIASGSEDHTIKLWDVSTRQCLKTLEQHTDWVWSVAFSRDGATLVSGGGDCMVRLWDVNNGHCLKSWKNDSQVLSVAFSPDGQIIATGDEKDTVKLWNVSTGKPGVPLQGHTGRVRSVAFSPNGQLIASGGDDHTIKLWNVSTGGCLETLTEHTDHVWSVSFSPDGRILASSGEDQVIRLWQVDTYQCIKTFGGVSSISEDSAQVRTVAFSPDGAALASGSNRTVNLWDVKAGKSFKTLRGYSDSVQSVAFSPDTQTLASAGDDESVRLWNINTGQNFKILRGHTSRVWSVTFSPDGEALATSSSDHTVKLWNISTGQCLKTLIGHTSWVQSVVFSPDGQLIASAGDDSVKLWDISTGHCLKTLTDSNPQSQWVWTVAFSPDGQTLASAGEDQTVSLWNVRTGKCRKILKGHTSRLWSVAFSPDGQTLASAGDDKIVRLWDTKTGKPLKVLEGHTSSVRSVAFSFANQFIASGSDDQTVKLWRIDTGECQKTLEGHGDRVRSVTFSPDDKTLTSGGEDSKIKLWDITSGECTKTLAVPSLYEGLVITRVRGLTSNQKDTLKLLGAIEEC